MSADIADGLFAVAGAISAVGHEHAMSEHADALENAASAIAKSIDGLGASIIEAAKILRGGASEAEALL